LRRCLDGIRNQTVVPAEILVVDNASTDGTDRMLAEEYPEVRVHRTTENVGCAGAMHESLRVALELEPEYVWFFDDDVVPDPACLETLLREIRVLERERRVGVLRPMVRDPQTGDVAGGGISHGALLRGEMVATVGFPLAALFIELSDHTYNLRIRQHGYEILRVPAVLAEHPVDRPRRLRQIMKDGYRAKPWRLYYAVRNRIYFSLYLQPSVRLLARNLAMAVRTLILLTLFGRPRRGQVLVVRGILDGLLARLGRRVEPSY
jgi:GT2 family glycosyltransferase